MKHQLAVIEHYTATVPPKLEDDNSHFDFGESVSEFSVINGAVSFSHLLQTDVYRSGTIFEDILGSQFPEILLLPGLDEILNPLELTKDLDDT